MTRGSAGIFESVELNLLSGKSAQSRIRTRCPEKRKAMETDAPSRNPYFPGNNRAVSRRVVRRPLRRGGRWRER